MVYHKDKFRMLAHPELQALTNTFITQFNDLFAKLDGKRNDGYAFGYPLVECLINSDYLNSVNEDCYGNLLDMGFVQNVVNGYFERNIDKFELDTKIDFILNNYDNQMPHDDWRVTNLKSEDKPIDVEEFNMDVMLGHITDPAIPATYKVIKAETTKRFELHNNKSGYMGICEVKTIEGESSKILLYNHTGKELQLDIDTSYHKLEPRIMHYKYVSDINGFLNVINQVIYGITDNMEDDTEE